MSDLPQKVSSRPAATSLLLEEPPTVRQIYTRGIAEAMSPEMDMSLNNLRDLTQCILMEGLARKVEPPFFARLLDDTTEFLTVLARLEAAVHAKNALVLSDPDRKPDVLEAAISKLMPQISDLRLKMSEKTMQMALCADPGTTVS